MDDLTLPCKGKILVGGTAGRTPPSKRGVVRSIMLILFLVTFLPSMAVASSPSASATGDAEGLARQAKEHFAAKDFEVAAKLFMQAYAKSHAASLVFNAARAYEEAGKNGDAASLFRLYITLTDDADGIVEARQHLAKASPVLVDTTKVSQASTVKTAGVPSEKPVAASNTAAWVTASGAAAAGVTGITLMFLGIANSYQANADHSHTGDVAYHTAYGTAETQWIAGAILTGVGVALGGMSVYLWSKPVIVTPVRNGIALGGSF